MNNKIKKIIFSFILGLTFFTVNETSYTWFEDKIAESVKNAKLTGYPNMTFGEAVDGFVGNPKWKSIIADDGNSYVNLTGEILLHDKKVDLLIQYKINSDDSFELNSMELNEIPQNMLMYMGLIEKMYE